MKERIEKLAEIFRYVSSIELKDEILFDDLELYNKVTGESTWYQSIDDVEDDERIMEQVREIEFILGGGRGASVKNGKTLGFSSAAVRSKSTPIFPASLNNQGRFASVEGVIQNFIKKHGAAKREYSAAIDEQGFAHNYIKGGKSNVSVAPINGKFTAIHNHPSGGNFSSTDLHTFASVKNMSSLVATNDSKAYRITKTKRFDAKGFEKAMSRARWAGEDTESYNKGADRWLKRNAKRFGYVYSYQ
ncbi:TPA: hypothetical protein TY768_000919 [Streptococcus suis]|nr:hypothetical protein [Streptococcus suis]